jgi:hypothetical protein
MSKKIDETRKELNAWFKISSFQFEILKKITMLIHF